MLFPPGDTSFAKRRSRWREVEFMVHQICTILLPRVNFVNTLERWKEIARGLADSKRHRVRQSIVGSLS